MMCYLCVKALIWEKFETIQNVQKSVCPYCSERKEKTFGEVLAERFPDTDEIFYFNFEDSKEFIDWLHKCLYEADRFPYREVGK